QQLGEARLQLSPERGVIQTEMMRAEARHVVAAGMVELDRAAQVAVAKMTQSHRRLDEALVEGALRSGRDRPQILPNLVGLEKVPTVEQHDAGQVTRIVLRRLSHRGLSKCGPDRITTSPPVPDYPIALRPASHSRPRARPGSSLPRRHDRTRRVGDRGVGWRRRWWRADSSSCPGG